MATPIGSRAALKAKITLLEKQIIKYDPETISIYAFKDIETTLHVIIDKVDENYHELVSDVSADEKQLEKEYSKMHERLSDIHTFLTSCDDRFHRDLAQVEAEKVKKEEAEKAEKFKKEAEEKAERIKKEEEKELEKLKREEEAQIRKEEVEKELELARIAAGHSTPVHTPSSNVSRPKLPQLTLPVFSGKCEDWLFFRDRFNQAVHNRTDLAPVEKFTYLLSQVKGTAEDAIKSIQVDGSNYQAAYDRLQNLFENKRDIATHIADRIISNNRMITRSKAALLGILNDLSNSTDSLKSLDSTIDLGDLMMSRHIVQRLDRITRENYYKTLTDTSIPLLEGLVKFLEQEMLVIQASDSTAETLRENTGEKFKKSQDTVPRKSASVSKCGICNEEHKTFQCQKLMTAPEKERKAMVDKAKLCNLCLRSGHDLKTCSSSYRCHICKERHSAMLHMSFNKSKAEKSSTCHTTTYENSQVIKLKPTALINVTDHVGKQVELRALIDNCADDSFIQAAAVKFLGLQPKKLQKKISIHGLQSREVTTVSEYVTLNISSRIDPKVKHSFEAYVIQKVGNDYPAEDLEISTWDYLPKMALADPEFFKSRRVELLLSTDLYYEIVGEKIIRGNPGQPVATESGLGYLIGGGKTTSSASTRSCYVTSSIEEQFQKFFDGEQGHMEKPMLTPEEEDCEKHYEETTIKLPSGTYQVELPFKSDAPSLGESKAQAMKRFYSLESKFSRDSKLKEEYVKNMRELLQDGHMEQVPYSERIRPDKACYYLPHHAVRKESSTTTKLRIVFDASAKSYDGNSLNELLMIGPVIQQDLISILIRWRYWNIPLTADIKQMYLYIDVHPKHRDFLRILWRETEQEPVMTYRMKKVTFGTSSAPYQAIRTLMRLASDHQQDFPQAAAVLQRDFYVDDCLTGADTPGEAKELYRQLVGITAQANFTLRKWSTSCEEVLENIPRDLRETSLPLTLDTDDTTKALGLVWTPSCDEFKFIVQPSSTPSVTKRTILSEIAKVFDPLGFLAPVTIRAKILMQALWRSESGWDTRAPADILREWESYQQDVKLLESLRIPRCINSSNPKIYQLHGFCDASEKAYAAAVYLRIVTNSAPSMTLIAAKTRVAPVKGETIPRLELCGAVLLSQLMTTVRAALEIIEPEIYAWTDSTIALAWIKSQPQNWKTFIRNRVITIQSNVPRSCWLHVPGFLNPADLPSRGALSRELIDSYMWWNGPDFLHCHEKLPSPYLKPEMSLEFHPKFTRKDAEIVDREKKPRMPIVLLTEKKTWDVVNVFERYSSWTRLRRHAAVWLRLLLQLQYKIKKGSTPITPEELSYAEERIIHVLQKREYGKELEMLETGQELPKKSALLSLTPFLHDGIIRVGGRLAKADLQYDNRHPIFLPRSHVSDLIIRGLHLENLHAGNTLLLSLLQRKFWIFRGKSQVKKMINQCFTCVILRAHALNQLMGDLPEPRVRISEPFTHTGIDYAGPVIIRESNLKKARTQKAWIAVFVCFATKAVTLELVSDLTSDAFRSALRRFVSRRRWPSTLNSDNGTTFVGAARELQEVYDFTTTQDFDRDVVKYLTDHGTKWKFIPPGAPHMGGLWEAAVKSTKYHLKRVIGKTALTYEEYDTLLKQVEACLNSRPLCAASSDPNDLTAITPGHLITGHPPGAVPESDIRELKVNTLDRWQHVQQMLQHFWIRWKDEYLQKLQHKTKWKTVQPNISVGDLVVVRDNQHPPLFWQKARVEEIHPDPTDVKGLVRAVTVRTALGSYKRPITKLVLLSCEDEDEPGKKPTAEDQD